MTETNEVEVKTRDRGELTMRYLTVLMIGAAIYSCGEEAEVGQSDGLSCGPGTKELDGQCVPDDYVDPQCLGEYEGTRDNTCSVFYELQQDPLSSEAVVFIYFADEVVSCSIEPSCDYLRIQAYLPSSTFVGEVPEERTVPGGTGSSISYDVAVTEDDGSCYTLGFGQDLALVIDGWGTNTLEGVYSSGPTFNGTFTAVECP